MSSFPVQHHYHHQQQQQQRQHLALVFHTTHAFVAFVCCLLVQQQHENVDSRKDQRHRGRGTWWSRGKVGERRLHWPMGWRPAPCRRFAPCSAPAACAMPRRLRHAPPAAAACLAAPPSAATACPAAAAACPPLLLLQMARTQKNKATAGRGLHCCQPALQLCQGGCCAACVAQFLYHTLK